MDTRVAALEADMREVKSILARMEPVLRAVGESNSRIEKRMDGLEHRVDGLDDRLRKVEIDNAEIKARVTQLPTAWTFITAGIGLVLGNVAILRFAFPR